MKRRTSDKRPHKRNYNVKEREKKEQYKQGGTKKLITSQKKKNEEKAKVSELHPWRFELEICPSLLLPCGHPYNWPNSEYI